MKGKSESHSVVSDSLPPYGLYRPWNSPDQNTGVGNLSLLQGIFPTQRLNSVSHIAGSFFPAEPPGKPKNTGVGSLSLLQRIFPTQESNQGLLHCRQILYQLSYSGSPTREGTSMRSQCTSTGEQPLFTTTREKPAHSNQAPAQSKIKLNNFF